MCIVTFRCEHHSAHGTKAITYVLPSFCLWRFLLTSYFYLAHKDTPRLVSHISYHVKLCVTIP